MKVLRILSTILALGALTYYGYSYFAKPNGKTYDIDKHHHVYYKGSGVTEEDAGKTADYLKELGLVQSTEGMDVQIKSDKPGDDVKLSFVFDKSKITPEAETSALAVGSELSSRIFNGRKVIVAFVDDDMDDIKNLGFAPSQNQTQPEQNTRQTDDEK